MLVLCLCSDSWHFTSKEKLYNWRSQTANSVAVLYSFTSIKHPICLALSLSEPSFRMSRDFREQNCPLEKRAVTQGGIIVSNQIYCQVIALKRSYSRLLRFWKNCQHIKCLHYFIIFYYFHDTWDRKANSFLSYREDSFWKKTYVRKDDAVLYLFGEPRD